MQSCGGTGQILSARRENSTREKVVELIPANMVIISHIAGRRIIGPGDQSDAAPLMRPQT
jgi:hypothetical protein